MKTCGTCKESLPDADFNKKSSRRDGLAGSCRPCSKRHQKNHYEKHTSTYKTRAKETRAAYKAWVNGLKSAPCMDCKRTYNPWQMEFDHVRETKQFSISEGIRRMVPRDVMLSEIQKCDLVCSNCHKDRTYQRSVT